MAQWTFITNHGLVFAHIAKYPRSTTRTIASTLDLAERTVQRIIADLEAEEYVARRRVGRNNEYSVNPRAKLRHETTRNVGVQSFINMLR